MSIYISKILQVVLWTSVSWILCAESMNLEQAKKVSNCAPWFSLVSEWILISPRQLLTLLLLTNMLSTMYWKVAPKFFNSNWLFQITKLQSRVRLRLHIAGISQILCRYPRKKNIVKTSLFLQFSNIFRSGVLYVSQFATTLNFEN